MLNKDFDSHFDEKDLDDKEDKQTQIHLEEKNDGKIEALFNPLEDEDNQRWLKKHKRQGKRPLTCPSCFVQIAYNYSLKEGNSEEPEHLATEVFGVEVK